MAGESRDGTAALALVLRVELDVELLLQARDRGGGQRRLEADAGEPVEQPAHAPFPHSRPRFRAHGGQHIDAIRPGWETEHAFR